MSSSLTTGTALAQMRPSIQKLPLPHYHARISTQSGDLHFARHNQYHVQRSTKCCACSGCFWKSPPPSWNSGGTPTSNCLKVSCFPSSGGRDFQSTSSTFPIFCLQIKLLFCFAEPGLIQLAGASSPSALAKLFFLEFQH